MTTHPDEAAKERAANRSYIFCRITGLSNDNDPVGAQGVPLTAGRSIAVDRLHEYGTPFFIEANLPSESVRPASPFRRLMIAQDTGSAIVGPARADLYMGSGDEAARVAGRIRNHGRFVMLLPRELDMVAAGKHMPLPLPKPSFAEVAGRTPNQAVLDKPETDSRASAAYARGTPGHRTPGASHTPTLQHARRTAPSRIMCTPFGACDSYLTDGRSNRPVPR
jgi:membrane-bound lytic murein transglycosylase A